LICSLIIFLFINSCDKKNIIRNDDNYVLSGTVLINTQPADNYIVSIVYRPDITTNTNSNGKFTINDLEIGTYKLKIEKQYSDSTIIIRYENVYIDRDTTYQPFNYKRLKLQYELGKNPRELKIYWSGIEDKDYEYLLYEVTDNNIDSLIYTASDILDSSYIINDFEYWKEHIYKIISHDTIGNYQDDMIQYNNPETGNLSGIVKGDGYLVPNDPYDSTLIRLYKNDIFYDSTRSDVNGEFSFSKVVTGQYTLKAEREFPFENFAYGNEIIDINTDNDEYVEILLDSIKYDYFPIFESGTFEYKYDNYYRNDAYCNNYDSEFDILVTYQETTNIDNDIKVNFIEAINGITIRDTRDCGGQIDTTIVNEQHSGYVSFYNGEVTGYSGTIYDWCENILNARHLFFSYNQHGLEVKKIIVVIDGLDCNAIQFKTDCCKVIFLQKIMDMYIIHVDTPEMFLMLLK
jgi:hypothetical protein